MAHSNYRLTQSSEVFLAEMEFAQVINK